VEEIKQYLTNNECYKVGEKMSNIKGVMLHSTATPGATPENFAKSWNTYRPNGRQVCVHAFADDTKVINTLPYNIRAWGCGGTGNNNYIQIEICEPSEVYFENGWKYKSKDTDKTKTYVENTVNILVEWTVNRLIELGIKEVNTNTVTSHYEGYKAGIASNHGDPKGILSLADLDMDDIREKCKILMNSKLGGSNMDKSETSVKTGDSVKLKDGAVQYNGNNIKEEYKTKEYIVSEIRGDRAVLTLNGVVMYAVSVKYLTNTEQVFKEGHEPSSYAASAWKKAIEKGIIDGTNPKGALTREQLTIILDRLGLLD
jgi:N-acetylmuramoyl-L-alanine amidase